MTIGAFQVGPFQLDYQQGSSPFVPPTFSVPPAGRVILHPKRASETLNLAFDFLSVLGTHTTIASQSVTSVVYSGVDPTPSAMISGSATHSGTIVKQTITGGVTGVIYGLNCRVVTNLGGVCILSAYLVVEPDFNA